MPAKKQPVTKKVTRDESSSEDEQVVVEKPVTKKETKEVPKSTKKSKETEEKPVEKKTQEKGKWEELSDDNVSENSNNDPAFSDDQDEQKQNISGPNKQRTARYANSATNFDYSQYETLDTSVSDLNNRDLIKVLIVRAYKDGQHQLCKTLKQTLRAMNLECDFPSGPNKREQLQRPSTSAPRTGFRGGRGGSVSGRPQGEFSGRQQGEFSGRQQGEFSKGGYGGNRSQPQFRRNDHASFE
jgi:hypothetical protein